MRIQENSYHSTRGQALLVLVLLIALVITVVTSISYRLTTETQSAKSQEENVRALAAADSGIERGIRLINTGAADAAHVEFNYGAPEVGLGDIAGINPNRSLVSIDNTTDSVFISPEIPQDEQYTFYVSNYPSMTTPFSGNLIVRFGSNPAGQCNSSPRTEPAVEVTIIHGAQSELVDRLVYEPCSGASSIGGTTISPNTTSVPLSNNGQTFTFRYSNVGNVLTISPATYPNAKFIIVRVLFGDTRLAFQRQGAGAIPVQGKVITSEAVSVSGTSKVVTLLQTFPQIPADFFVTTF